MAITPAFLTTLSLALLALALLVAGGILVAGEVRRARSGRTIDRAIRHGASDAPDPATHEADGRPLSDADLPMHWLATRFGRALVADEDRRLIEQAGFASRRAQLIFLVARIGMALLLPALAYVIWIARHPQQQYTLLILAAAFVVGFLAPKWLLRQRAATRREQVAYELPLFVDLLRLLQGVGLSLDQSLQIMAQEFSHVLRVLARDLEMANRQYGQGRTREHSLQRLGTLYDNESLAGLVALLVQVDRHGGAVQEPLRLFGERLREHRRMEMKERIGKITVKMTGVMVLTLLPALLIVAAGPGFLAVIRALGGMAK